MNYNILFTDNLPDTNTITKSTPANTSNVTWGITRPADWLAVEDVSGWTGSRNEAKRNVYISLSAALAAGVIEPLSVGQIELPIEYILNTSPFVNEAFTSLQVRITCGVTGSWQEFSFPYGHTARKIAVDAAYGLMCAVDGPATIEVYEYATGEGWSWNEISTPIEWRDKQ